jgi:hypothetical protein
MTILKPCFALSLLLGLGGPGLEAQAPAAAVPVAQAPLSLKAADLKEHPFVVDGLQLTVESYTGDDLLGARVMDFRLQNTTQAFLSFRAGDLLVVGASGDEAVARDYTHGQMNSTLSVPARLSLAPGAGVSLFRNLGARVGSPAKLYFRGRLVALITG